MKTIKNEEYIPHGALILTKSKQLHDFKLKKICRNTNHIWELEIHPIDFCPLKCKGCSYSGRHSGNQIDYGKLISYVDDKIALGVNSIFLSGGGDPSNWSKLNDFLYQYSGRSVHIGISTNLVTIQEINELSKIDHFQIHVVGFNRESTFSECGVDIFDRLNKNYECLFDNVKNKSITIKVLLTKQNYQYIGEYLDYLCKFSADTIIIKTIQDFEKNARIWEDSYNTRIRDVVFSHRVTELYDYVIDNLEDVCFDNPAPRQCYVATKGLYRLVRPNGDIFPCVAGTISEQNRIGNIVLGESLDSIDFSYNAISKRCPLRACRHYRFNSYIEKHGLVEETCFDTDKMNLL